MKYLLLVGFALLVQHTYGCCLPPKFTVGYNARIDVWGKSGIRRYASNVTMRSKIYFNEETVELYNGGSGKVSIDMGIGYKIDIPVSFNLGLDNNNLWYKYKYRNPLTNSWKEKCQYIKIIGDMPTNAIRCNIETAVEVDRFANGSVVYHKQIAPFANNTITVDDQCIPVKEVLDIDVERLLQLAGTQVPPNTEIETEAVATTFDRKTTVDPSLAHHEKPRVCELKRVIRLPRGEGDISSLLQQSMINAASEQRRKRSTDYAMSRIKREMARIVKESVKESYELMVSGI